MTKPNLSVCTGCCNFNIFFVTTCLLFLLLLLNCTSLYHNQGIATAFSLVTTETTATIATAIAKRENNNGIDNNTTMITEKNSQRRLPWRDKNRSPLTGIDLRDLVLEASINDESNDDDDDDGTSNSFLDVPGIAFLEHINLIVGGTDRTMAENFYIDVMGMTKDKSKSFHVNIGRQQFHLSVPNNNNNNNKDERDVDEIPHRIYGSIGLAVPDLQSLKERLMHAKNVNDDATINCARSNTTTDTNNYFSNTLFDFYEEEQSYVVDTNADTDDDNIKTTTTTTRKVHVITVRCPWGNVFRCYSAHDRGLPSRGLPSSSSSSLPLLSSQKMTNLHSSQIGQHGPDRMGVLSVGQPGIRFLELLCPYGTTKKIYDFYRQLLHCSCTLFSTKSTTTTATTIITACCAVSVGPGVHLVFVEEEEKKESLSELMPTSTSSMMTMMQGVHICIYVHDFYGLYNRLSERSLIWTNPRFTHLDSCSTWEEAKHSRTLRFRYIFDINTNNAAKDIISKNNSTKDNKNEDTKEIILELEHEVRPLRHGQFMKAPYYVPK